MAAEPVNLSALHLDGEDRRNATVGARIFEPQRAVRCATIAGRAEVESDTLDALAFHSVESELAVGPHLDLGHVDERERCLILIRAGAGARVVGRVQHAVGDDEVRRAAGFETAEVRRAAHRFEIIESRGSGAVREQVFARDDGVASIGAVDAPRLHFSRERIADKMRLAVLHIEHAVRTRVGICAGEDDVVMQDARARVFVFQILPEDAAIAAAAGDHAVADFAGQSVAGLRSGLEQDVVLLGIAEPCAEDVCLLLPENCAGLRVEGDDAVVGRQRSAAPLKQVLGVGGELVEAVDAAVASDDAVVQEAVPRLHAPEQCARVAVECREAVARGVVVNGRRLARGGTG